MGFFQNLLKGVTGTLTRNPLGVLGGAISTGMGLFSGTKKQEKLMKYQNELQMQNYERERADKLADYQMQLQDQKAMIADERQYNSIGAQMQRARDANVSPLAALGVGSGNTLASVPSLSQASAQGTSMPADTSASHMGNSIQAIMSLKNIELRDEELQIQKQIADAQVAKTNAEADAIREKMPFISQEAQAHINDLIATGDLKGAQKALVEEQEKTENALRDVKVASIKAQTALAEAESATIDALRDSKLQINYWTAKRMYQDIQESIARESSIGEDINLKLDQGVMNVDLKRKLSKEVRNLDTLHRKMISEIESIESNTDLNNARKTQMVANAVRDFATSGTQIANTIKEYIKLGQKDNKISNSASSALNDYVADMAVAYMFD